MSENIKQEDGAIPVDNCVDYLTRLVERGEKIKISNLASPQKFSQPRSHDYGFQQTPACVTHSRHHLHPLLLLKAIEMSRHILK